MDAAAFEQVYQDFQEFHAYFAPLFGRRETREHSGHYLQALLVQSGERRNAENLSETVPGSARGMQRFLTDSPWDDEAIIGRLQEYLGTRLEHPGRGVGAGRQRLSQAGSEVGGSGPSILRETGEGGQLPGGDVPGLGQPVGTGALVDKRLYLPESWTKDPERCAEAGVPEERRGYRSKTELALETLRRALELGHLRAGWVAADDAFGMSPSLREGLAALGMRYVLDVPAGFTVWPPEPAWTSAEYQGFGRPRKPRLVSGQRPNNAGRRRCHSGGCLAGDHGGPGKPGTTQLPVQRPAGAGRPAGASPAKSTGPSTAGTWTAANPATTCPMLRRIHRWRPWHMWVAPAGV